MRILSQLAVLCFSALLGTAALADKGFSYEFIGESGVGKTTLINVLIGTQGRSSHIALNPGQDGAVYGDFGARKLFVVDEKNKEVMDVGQMMAAYRNSGFAGSSQPAADLDATQDLLRKTMEDALANVPKSQRPAMRKILEQQMGIKPKPAKKPKPAGSRMEVTETGETRFENAVEQHLIVISIGGDPVSRIWVTDPANIDGGQVMVDAMADLGDLFDELVGDMVMASSGKDDGMNTFEFARQMALLNKFPIETIDIDEGESFMLESAIERDFDDEAFEPPAGYRLRTMIGG